MRLSKAVFSLIVFMLFASQAYAAPAYGTKMPEKFKLAIGGQSQHVISRELEGPNGKMESLQHFFLISFGLTDWLSVDLKGGAGNIEAENGAGFDLDYNTFVGGGYGFRIKIFEKEKWKSVLGFQHISIHPYTRNIDNEKYKSVLDDWQGSLLVSYDLDKFTPYVGAKLSRMDYIFWENGERNRIKSENSKSLGVVAGFDLNINEKNWINIEGQLLDVTAVAVSINHAF